MWVFHTILLYKVVSYYSGEILFGVYCHLLLYLSALVENRFFLRPATMHHSFFFFLNKVNPRTILVNPIVERSAKCDNV